jgi:hypothetical protein
MCICSEIQAALESGDVDAFFNDGQEADLLQHVQKLHQLLSASKRLEQIITFSISPKKKKAKPSRSIFQENFTNLEERQSLFTRCRDDVQYFWNPYPRQEVALLKSVIYLTFDYLIQAPHVELFHQVLLRRFSCTTIFLFSVISGRYYDPGEIAKSFHNAGLHHHQTEEELIKKIRYFRDSGRRYIDISSRLGGMGVLWWLPLEALPTTYVLSYVTHY